MTNQELTEKEWEFIQAIRNYKKAYPNGARSLLYYITQLFDELFDRD